MRIDLKTTAFITACVALAACGTRDDADPTGAGRDLHIYADKLTGCQYVSIYNRGMSPRMRADGTQVCGSVK